MNSIALKDILHRAENWSDEDKQELMRAALYIEQRQAHNFDITRDDWSIIEARLEAARLGAIATDEEVEAVFSKYRAA